MDKILISVLDPDLEIRRGPGHRDPEIREGPKIFSPSGPQFGLKIRGGGGEPPGPPLDPPLIFSCKGIQIPEKGKFLLGSGVLEIFACGIRNPRNICLWNLGVRNPTND